MEYKNSSSPKFDIKVKEIQMMLNKSRYNAYSIVREESDKFGIVKSPLLSRNISHRNYVPAGWNEIQTDGLFGKDTEQAVLKFQEFLYISQNGIVGDTTYSYLTYFSSVNIPFGGLLSNSKESELKKKVSTQTEISSISQSYTSNIKSLLTEVVSIIKSFLETNKDILTGRAASERALLDKLNDNLKLSIKLRENAWIDAKRNMAKLDNIKLNLTSLKSNTLYRRMCNFVSSTNESEKVLSAAVKNQWNKVQQSVIRTLKSYNATERIQREINKHTQNWEALCANASRSGKFAAVGGFVKFLLNWGDTIWLACHYEDTAEWNSKMEKKMKVLMDQLIVDLVVALIPLVIAILVAVGLIAAPSALLVTIVCIVVGLIGGLIIWMLEDNDIYPSIYLQDKGYEMTYKLLYR